MAEPEQLDIRELKPGTYRLEFPYNLDFVEYLKSRIPPRDRAYDPETHFWTVTGEHHLAALEGVGVQHFQYATKIFWRDGKEVWRNLKTGCETIQENLFA